MPGLSRVSQDEIEALRGNVIVPRGRRQAAINAERKTALEIGSLPQGDDDDDDDDDDGDGGGGGGGGGGGRGALADEDEAEAEF
jgi:hypothetical protein